MDAGNDEDLVTKERLRFKGWEADEPGLPEEYYERIYEEWDVADSILVNSTWTKKSIIKQGASADKIIIVPQAYEATQLDLSPKSRHGDRPLRVLYAGRVGLRKGVQYLMEAAKTWPASQVEVGFAGLNTLNRAALGRLPENIKLYGHLSKQDLENLYHGYDVFVFPTISDGFGMVQLEAMAYGMPVIASTNCGDAVEEGVNGFRIPICDPGAIRDSIQKFLDEPDLLERMSHAALSTAKRFSLDAYGEALMRGLPSHLKG